MGLSRVRGLQIDVTLSMGSLWRAKDMNLGADIAIKLIDPALAQSTEALQRFKREAQSAATIRSTYVVQILDHGVDHGTPFIAMELLKGESLGQRLLAVGKLSPEQTGRVLQHVGRALALAHENGIIHRDMKPENVFLVREDEDDVGKVLDFGIARQSGVLSDEGALKTQTGTILGTPYYMSPEQATGQQVDHLTDIWSFGVIASECLTGRCAATIVMGCTLTKLTVSTGHAPPQSQVSLSVGFSLLPA